MHKKALDRGLFDFITLNLPFIKETESRGLKNLFTYLFFLSKMRERL